MKIGLFIGRFQPFHLGHLSAIKQALKKIDFLTIGIGSAQYSNTEDNPFTADDRESMIKASLEANGILKDRFKIVQIPDIHNSSEWPAHVRSLTPSFDTIFLCNNGIVKELFKKYDDADIKKVKKEIDISATQIRKLIADKDEKWKKFVPNAVRAYINTISHP